MMPINKVGNSPIVKALDKVLGKFKNKEVAVSPAGNKKYAETISNTKETELTQREVQIGKDNWQLISSQDELSNIAKNKPFPTDLLEATQNLLTGKLQPNKISEYFPEVPAQQDEGISTQQNQTSPQQEGLDILRNSFDQILTESQGNDLEALQAKSVKLQKIAQELIEFETAPEIEPFSELVFASIEMINHQIESIQAKETKPTIKAFNQEIKYATDHLHYLEKRYDHILDISDKIAIDDERSLRNLKQDTQNLLPELLDLQSDIDKLNDPALKRATEKLLGKMINFIELIDIKIKAISENKLRQIRSELDPIKKELTEELFSLLNDMTYHSKPEDHYEFRGRASNLFKKVGYFNEFCKERDPTYKLDKLNELVSDIKNVYPILDT